MLTLYEMTAQTTEKQFYQKAFTGGHGFREWKQAPGRAIAAQAIGRPISLHRRHQYLATGRS